METGTLSSRLLGQFEGDGLKSTLSIDKWPEPTDVTGISPLHAIVYFPPKRFEGTVRYADMGVRSTRPASDAFFRHAGLRLVGNGTGGQHKVARYQFSPQRFHEAAGWDIDIQEGEIWRGLDLSAAPLTPMLMRLSDEMARPGIASSTLIESGMTMLMVELARFIRRDSESRTRRSTLSRAQLDRLMERVRTSELPPPSVMELARLAGMSERHLLRLFRASTGESISAFVRREQILRAQCMLRDMDLPIKEIAFRLGYSNVASFTIAFHKSAGQTPGRYRQINRAD